MIYELFFEFIDKFNASELSNELWSKLSECFYVNKKNSTYNLKKDRYTRKVEEILFNGKAFEGIIDHLTKESGGNVSDNGTVKVKPSSDNSGRIAKNAVDLHNNQNYFQSDGIQNSWLKFDFGDKKVQPNKYSIRTRHDCNGYHPRNWVIEGTNVDSDNDEDWQQLDSRQNDTFLNNANVVHTYDISEGKTNKEFFRYLRIRQTGVDSSSNCHLTVSALELFGYLI